MMTHSVGEAGKTGSSFGIASRTLSCCAQLRDKRTVAGMEGRTWVEMEQKRDAFSMEKMLLEEKVTLEERLKEPVEE